MPASALTAMPEMPDVLSCRWAISIINYLSNRPTGFSQLAKELKISNKVLSEKLKLLMQESLVEKLQNSTSVYSISERGREILYTLKPLLTSGMTPLEISSILRCKWTISILKTLWNNQLRASQIIKELPGISWKMLSDRLKKLCRMNLVERVILPSYPVTITYRLTGKGKAVATWLKIYS